MVQVPGESLNSWSDLLDLVPTPESSVAICSAPVSMGFRACKPNNVRIGNIADLERVK